MTSKWLKSSTVLLSVAMATLVSCSGSDGDDGKVGPQGPAGPPGGAAINASQVTNEFLATLDVVGAVTGVTIASPPKVTFTLQTASGVPIVGIVPFWVDSDRYVRFTLAKLVPGTNGDPDKWVSYTRDATTNDPDYDTGSKLVDHGDGSYKMTWQTDGTRVPAVSHHPGKSTVCQ